MSERPKPPKLTPSSDSSELKPARIVIADDDRVAREMLAGILRGAGFTVEAMVDGQEAFERVAQGGVDLVLLDIVMPRLSGLETCRLLKGMTSEGFLPVVLVTVKTDTASRVEGLKIGADDYVCKPFEEQELIARVAAMLRIKRLHDHVASQRAKLERLSVHDELTGLYNYRYLHTRITEEFKRAERYHEPFACIVVDIDHLKAHNDLGGRKVGDALIGSVANAIRRCVRDVDVVARYGGEEFLVVLPSTHFAGSVTVAERIWREVMDQSTEIDGKAHNITVSLGVALYPSRDVRTKAKTRSSAPPTQRSSRPSARGATGSASSSSRDTCTRPRSAPARPRQPPRARRAWSLIRRASPAPGRAFPWRCLRPRQRGPRQRRRPRRRASAARRPRGPGASRHERNQRAWTAGGFSREGR
jgi:two-component system, cell cycle response regulator